MKFNIEAFGDREIELSKNLLAAHPENQKQRDRLAYWSLKKGDIETAKQYGDSPKMRQMVERWEKENATN